MLVIEEEIRQQIIRLASKYETPDFLPTDPSSFMHKVNGDKNQEAMAFIASCLSYGARKQFFPKIQFIFDVANGEIDHWLRSDDWKKAIPDSTECYYRLYTFHDMHCLLSAYSKMLHEYDTMKAYVAINAKTGIEAVSTICKYFAEKGASKIIPKNTFSACKRICMFLRWMVRNDSPVDLGLWADIIDRRSLIMPLDTHVVQEAKRMKLLTTNTASMRSARRLTECMLEIFPNDPLKGDFALFGLGVDKENI